MSSTLSPLQDVYKRQEKFDGREKAEAARAEVIGARTVRVVNVAVSYTHLHFHYLCMQTT